MKRWIALLLVVVMLFSCMGCSFIARKATDKALKNIDDKLGGLVGDTDNDDDDAKEILVSGDFYALENYLDIMDHFQEFEYIWISDGSEYKVNLQYLGKETVDGSTVNHFLMRTEEGEQVNKYEIWTSDNPDLYRAIIDDEEYTGEIAQAMADFAGAQLIWFFAFSEMWSEVFSQEGGYESAGWKLINRSTTNRSYGAGSVRVERFEFQYKYLTVDATSTYEVAKIGGKNMFVSWDFTHDNSQYSMEITRLIPR